MRALFSTLLVICLGCSPRASSSQISGDWLGAIDVPPGIRLRIVFHIRGAEGNVSAMMDSLEQNAKGIPDTTVSYDGVSLILDMPNVGGKFSGRTDKELQTISGGRRAACHSLSR